jgi:hypothetical protein
MAADGCDLAKLVLDDRHARGTDVVLVVRCLARHSRWHHLFHLESLLALLGAILESQLFEVNIAPVVDDACIARGRSSLLQEVGKLLALAGPGRVVHLAYFSAECCLRHSGIAKMGLDLPPEIITRIVNGDIFCFLAVEVYPIDVELCQVFHLGLLRLWQLDAIGLSREEVSCRGFVGLVIAARDWPLELHEAAVGVAIDVQASLELGDFHLSRSDQAVDLGADLVAVPLEVHRAILVIADRNIVVNLERSFDVQIRSPALTGFGELLELVSITRADEGGGLLSFEPERD